MENRFIYLRKINYGNIAKISVNGNTEFYNIGARSKTDPLDTPALQTDGLFVEYSTIITADRPLFLRPLQFSVRTL